MAVNVGNPSALGPQRSFRAGVALSTHTHPEILSVTPSAPKWPHLVQNQLATRRFESITKPSLLGFKRSLSPKISRSVKVAAVQAKISTSTPLQADAGNVTLIYPEAIEDSPSTIEENLVKDISIPSHQLRQSEFLDYRTLYRQKYVIRSYEVGADNTMPITTIISLFQDVSVSHVHLLGIAAEDGFGETKTMHRLGLIWVMAKIHAEVVNFPKWSDVIEIDSWFAPAGKNAIRYDWIVRRCETNEVLVRTTSTWCLMHSTKRRICKMPDSVRAEMEPFFSTDRFVFQQIGDELSDRSITKFNDLTAKYSISALKSCRSDLDRNQHVTNARYISWLLQSLPDEHMETHSLASISIEYRRECRVGDVLESLTSSKETVTAEPGCADSGLSSSEFAHLLRSQGSTQHEIARARTTWRPKPSKA